MKAMILAAGEGKRLQPLTLKIPKPLLKVGSSSLIEDQINRLLNLGINDFIINISYLGEQIKESLKIPDGSPIGTDNCNYISVK